MANQFLNLQKNKKVGEIRTDLIDHFNATFHKEGTK